MSERYKFKDPEGWYFVTSSIVDWIDLFTRKELKYVIIKSLQYCQRNKGLEIGSWCLMPSHLHMIIKTKDIELPAIMRDFKKYTAKKIIETIKEINESRAEWLLNAFAKSGEKLTRIKNYKVWQDGNHPEQLLSNRFIDQKLDYIHLNPVEAEIVELPEHYWYSSARDYMGEKGLLEIELLK